MENKLFALRMEWLRNEIKIENLPDDQQEAS